VSLNTECKNNELFQGIHVCKMSYQMVISGPLQHPGEIGRVYCCHFTDAKGHQRAVSVWPLGSYKPASAESSETSIVMLGALASFSTTYWLGDIAKVM
jgi:hypothetical protein